MTQFDANAQDLTNIDPSIVCALVVVVSLCTPNSYIPPRLIISRNCSLCVRGLLVVSSVSSMDL